MSYPNDQGNPAGATPVYIAGVAGSKDTVEAGDLLIGKSDGGFALANLTAGKNVTIDNGDGTITINATGDEITILDPDKGGTGVDNGDNTLTMAGDVVFAGAFASKFNVTAATDITFPTTGTLVPSVPITKPAASGWTTWINQNGSSVVDGVTGMVFTWKALTVANYSGNFNSLGGATTFTARALFMLAATSFNGCGIALRESATGKMYGFRYGFSGFFRYEDEVYTSPTTRVDSAGTTGVNNTVAILQAPLLRMRLSGGNVICEVSVTGETGEWVSVVTPRSIASVFTTAPDQYGFYSSSNGGDQGMVVQSVAIS